MKKVIHNLKNSLLFKAIFWVIISLVLTGPLLAEANGITDGAGLDNPLKADTFAKLVEDIANIVFMVGFPIAVIFIIYSGLLFVTARGNEEDLKKAKRTFLWAVIGAAILLGAKIIAMAVKELIESLQ